jgi:hypothetical protein
MKGRQIVIGQVFGRDAAALMQDGQLEDLIIDPSGAMPFATRRDLPRAGRPAGQGSGRRLPAPARRRAAVSCATATACAKVSR